MRRHTIANLIGATREFEEMQYLAVQYLKVHLHISIRLAAQHLASHDTMGQVNKSIDASSIQGAS